ncbi:MAG: orotidine-5'-phosphate decarboxylase [Candidatus Kaiserbacteria bacterium]|nr:orotidine-5'-phosphate decarboxylase [Candidatus Kaiserbacteria bacterium]
MVRDFSSLLKKREGEGKHICVGLESVLNLDSATFPLIRDVADSVSDLVCAFKINPALFFGRGDIGFEWLLSLVSHITSSTDVPVILDIKCGDIDVMNDAWKTFAFDTVAADAVTVNPWGGFDSLNCFFRDTPSKGVFIWCRSSASGHGGPQTFSTNMIHSVYERVLHTAFKRWGSYPGFGVVLGANDARALALSRHIVGDKVPILVPGVGHQGGKISEVVPAIAGDDGRFIINVGRSIIDLSRSHNLAEVVRQNVENLNHAVVHALAHC